MEVPHLHWSIVTFILHFTIYYIYVRVIFNTENTDKWKFEVVRLGGVTVPMCLSLQ